ncbi:MAG TPA: uracil-DNA glycosylase [Tepidisphaeraceae bacterium]|nr:uracil-DNA glycosylase [Tepidisphaeraceae bacterium]
MLSPTPMLNILSEDIVHCDRCSRLREYCLEVARVKRRAFAAWDYWGKPVPGFGDPAARLWIVGLAPAAHGANRTGRVFTGDRSGDFLFAALHRAGFANQPASVRRDDGLILRDCFISAAVRCAPPDNKPLPVEQQSCAIFLQREWDLLKNKRAILALGKIAWDATITLIRSKGIELAEKPNFGHGAVVALSKRLRLIGSYHVSQQNTFTGKLTEAMFDKVLRQCRSACED